MCDDITMKRISNYLQCSPIFEKHYFCFWDETIFFCNLQKIGVGSKHLFALKILSIKLATCIKTTTNYWLLVPMTVENGPAVPPYLCDSSDSWLTQEMCVPLYF